MAVMLRDLAADIQEAERLSAAHGVAVCPWCKLSVWVSARLSVAHWRGVWWHPTCLDQAKKLEFD